RASRRTTIRSSAACRDCTGNSSFFRRPVPFRLGSVENRPVPQRQGAERLDIWLDGACLFKTRSEAQKACKGGKVSVNGQSAKPHREVKTGDVIEITRPLGRQQRVVVAALGDRD